MDGQIISIETDLDLRAVAAVAATVLDVTATDEPHGILGLGDWAWIAPTGRRPVPR